jgi:hypothetical protein
LVNILHFEWENTDSSVLGINKVVIVSESVLVQEVKTETFVSLGEKESSVRVFEIIGDFDELSLSKGASPVLRNDVLTSTVVIEETEVNPVVFCHARGIQSTPGILVLDETYDIIFEFQMVHPFPFTYVEDRDELSMGNWANTEKMAVNSEVIKCKTCVNVGLMLDLSHW